MRGGKNGLIKKQIGVNRAVLGRFGYFRPPDRVRHAALNIFHRSNRKSVGWEPSLAPKSVWVAPNRPCRKRHWFPADGIDCLPFWSGRFFQRSYIHILPYIRGRAALCQLDPLVHLFSTSPCEYQEYVQEISEENIRFT